MGARGLTEAVARVQADVEAQEEALGLRGHGGCSVEVLLTPGKAQCLANLGQHQVIRQPGCKGLQVTGGRGQNHRGNNTHTLIKGLETVLAGAQNILWMRPNSGSVLVGAQTVITQ